jgi:hypothetical protein
MLELVLAIALGVGSIVAANPAPEPSVNLNFHISGDVIFPIRYSRFLNLHSIQGPQATMVAVLIVVMPPVRS